ncbi:MAG: TetR/AcrR family transcriptional regulator [Bacteroidetes bacterium]|nr:TetR/AcrR family transcriptional regulator [Bacteroidota bacterium]
MNYTEVGTEPESKIDIILTAAQKRLGLFGYEKTTMQEIADDIAMSKAALYYYFPDKESLFKAVLENEQNEYFRLIDQRLEGLKDAEKMITNLVDQRQILFQRFLNLGKFRVADNHKMKPLLKELYKNLREKEISILTKIFQQGKDDGIFGFDTAGETAILFSDMLQGIRIVSMKRLHLTEMSTEETHNMKVAIQSTTKIFINGLKYNALHNIKK